MKTYLVTGGAGFIGSNFITYIFAKNYNNIRVINIDNLTYSGNLENLAAVEGNPNYEFIQGDVCDKNLITDVMGKNDIDYVVHFAAETHVDRSIENSKVFADTNILGTLNLLNCAKKSWEEENGFKPGKKFLYVSTDEVYGDLLHGGFFTEKTLLSPRNPYAASKAGAEMMVKAYYETHRLPINITRCSNNYGPYQFPEKLIPLLINNCINHKYLPIYGDGQNIRDWLFVDDHCKAIDMVITKGRLGEVYNIGGHNERTTVEIAKIIVDYLNKNYDSTITENLIKFVTDRKGHDRRYAIDSKKVSKELGWLPDTNFQDGIKKTIKWYIENQIWMNGITSGEYQNYYKKHYDNR